MKKAILFFLVTLFLSCGNPSITDEITRLEKEHTETPTSDVKKKLLASYKIYLNDLKQDDNAFSDISQKTATLEVDFNQYQDAATTLMDAIKNHSSSTTNTANLQFLSSIMVNHIHPNNIQAVATDFKKLYPDAAQIKTAFLPILENLKTTMFDDKTGQWNRQNVRDYTSMAKIYVASTKNDIDAEKALFDAAKFARATKKYNEAIEIYNYIVAHPDDFERESAALFLKGFIYDEDLKNDKEAKKIYTEFLEKYPNDTYTASVQSSLDNLGKTAEEIIKGFGK